MAYIIQQVKPQLRQKLVATEKRAERVALEWAREIPGNQVDIFRETPYESTHVSSIFIKPAGVENAEPTGT